MTGPATDALTQLGRSTEPPTAPDRARLETVPNPDPDRVYLVRFTCPEFTASARSPASPTSPIWLSTTRRMRA